MPQIGELAERPRAALQGDREHETCAVTGIFPSEHIFFPGAPIHGPDFELLVTYADQLQVSTILPLCIAFGPEFLEFQLKDNNTWSRRDRFPISKNLCLPNEPEHPISDRLQYLLKKQIAPAIEAPMQNGQLQGWDSDFQPFAMLFDPLLLSSDGTVFVARGRLTNRDGDNSDIWLIPPDLSPEVQAATVRVIWEEWGDDRRVDPPPRGYDGSSQLTV